MNRLQKLPIALALTLPLAAQTNPQPRPQVSWKQQEITFTERTPLTGLPLGSFPSRTHCTEDGTIFFDPSQEATSSVDLSNILRISPTGEVTRLLRKLPLSPQGPLSALTFTTGTQSLVTLLKVNHPDDAPRAEPHYLLSVSNRDGDFAKLIDLDLRFTPIKVGVFGTGEYLVLGWDEVNRHPLLAELREDGTVYRFLQFEAKDRDLLQTAEFSPWGNDLLLTYPGTANPILLLRTTGQDEPMPLLFPSGYVLRDLMTTGPGFFVLVRAQLAAHPKDVRLFEMTSFHGNVVRELVTDKQRAVVCAAGRKVTAIFEDTITGKSDQTGSNTEPVKQWVIAHATR